MMQWSASFAYMPVESIVHEYQADYYQALDQSTKATDSAPFIEFMLTMTLNTINTITPKLHNC
ncbi:MAG: hypothetical protein P8I62_06520 [Pseudomonadales bacterium]|nr:hypothetical protein [Pseudomonadales bacterium]